jgi:hypothetical protein
MDDSTELFAKHRCPVYDVRCLIVEVRTVLIDQVDVPQDRLDLGEVDGWMEWMDQ